MVFPAGDDYYMTLQDVTGFNYGQYGAASNQKAYVPKCNGLRNVDFRISFPNPDVGKDIKIRIEVYKVSFDPANGMPFYTTSTGTNIFTSSDEVLNSSNSTLYYFPATIAVDPNTYYYANIMYKKKTLGIWSPSWNQKLSNNVNFLGGGANTNAAGFLNTEAAVLMSSSTGNVPVELFDPANDVMLNALATTCEDRYGIEIEEFNLSNWTGVAGTHYNSGWIFGQAPTINLSESYPEPFRNAVYRVVLFAGPSWSSVQFFMKPKSKTGRFIKGQESGGVAPDETADVSVFPNPSNGMITLSSQYSGNVYYELLDQLGRSISKDLLMAKESRRLDLSAQAKGIYLLKLTYGGRVQTRKLFLQ